MAIEKLPQDSNYAVIQAMGVDDTTHVTTTFNATAGSVVVPSGSKVIELNTNIACHIKFGAAAQADADTGDRYLPAGSYIYAVLPGQAEVNCVWTAGETTTGIVSVTRML